MTNWHSSRQSGMPSPPPEEESDFEPALQLTDHMHMRLFDDQYPKPSSSLADSPTSSVGVEPDFDVDLHDLHDLRDLHNEDLDGDGEEDVELKSSWRREGRRRQVGNAIREESPSWSGSGFSAHSEASPDTSEDLNPFTDDHGK